MGVDHPIPKFLFFQPYQFLVGPQPGIVTKPFFSDCNVAGVNLVMNNACHRGKTSVVVNGVNLVINNACHRGKTWYERYTALI